MSWNPPHRPPPPARPPAPPLPPGIAPGRGPAREAAAWGHALIAVTAAFAAMALTAWLGLWLLGAGDLGGGTMPALVAATVALGAGGRVGLSASGGPGGDDPLAVLAGDLGAARGTGEIDVMLLGVGLIGAITLGALFLRPLRHRLVVGAAELGAHAARVGVLAAAALGGVVALGRHDLPLGDIAQGAGGGEGLGGFLDLGVAARFAVDPAATMTFGLLWTALALAVSVAVSVHRPVPLWWQRHRDTLRPPVAGVLAVLLGAVVTGVLATPFVAAEAPSPRRMIGGMVLALPTVMFLLITLGLGIEWRADGDGDFSFGLPGPLGRLISESGSAGRPVTVARLAELDGRAWWVTVFAAVLLVLGATLAALRAPAGVRPWGHAARFAVALTLALLVAAYLAQVHLKVAVEILFGAIEPGAGVRLRPDYGMTVLLGPVWGACAGLAGGALAAWIRASRDGPAGAAVARPPGRGTAGPRPGGPAPGPVPGPLPGPVRPVGPGPAAQPGPPGHAAPPGRAAPPSARPPGSPPGPGPVAGDGRGDGRSGGRGPL